MHFLLALSCAFGLAKLISIALHLSLKVRLRLILLYYTIVLFKVLDTIHPLSGGERLSVRLYCEFAHEMERILTGR